MLAANLALLLNALIWGSVIPVLLLLLDTWDPIFLAVARYGLGVPVILVLLRLIEPAGLSARGVAWWRPWLLGGIGMGGFAPLYTVGIAHANPVVGAILSAAMPVTTTVVAWVMHRTPVERRAGLGIALAFAGAALATAAPEAGAGPFGLRGGEPLILLAQACWAWYSLTAQRWLQGWSQLRIAALTMLTGGVTLAGVWLVAAALGATAAAPPLPRTAEDIGLLLWLALAAVIGGLLLWNFGVRRVGAVIASLFMNLVPVVAILITAAALGTRPTTLQLCGGALVIAGVAQTQIRRALAARRSLSAAAAPPAPRR